eukprot:m.167566 g.167566  ORF g.167566 m.167566 type:complete len:858 (+) comp15306_c0_seq6:232-2805(+)
MRLIPRSFLYGSRSRENLSLLAFACVCLGFFLFMSGGHNTVSEPQIVRGPRGTLADIGEGVDNKVEEPEQQEKGKQDYESEENGKDKADAEPEEQPEADADAEPDPEEEEETETAVAKSVVHRDSNLCNPSESSPQEVRFLNKALGHNPSSRCRQEIHQNWCRLNDGKLMPELTRGDKQCTEPPGYISREKHPKHGQPARIAYVINAYQAGMFMQIKRLFRAIYHEENWYLFHIDKNSRLLRALLLDFCKDYKNAFVAPFSFETIWGSTKLSQTYLATMEFLIQYDWDFYINLSEADFPTKPLQDLRLYLGRRRGKSFLAGSIKPQKEKMFCDKQGINHTFYQCERFMYNLGKRQMPNYHPRDGFHFVGGSDWYIIERQYANYLVSDTSPYLQRIKQWYNMSLLSGESFFHSTAFNGPFCHSVLWYNLRNENWQGKAGCYCRTQVVDWCGCSPMVFRSKMMHLLKPKEDKFFARKFDPRISVHPINAVEAFINNRPDRIYDQKTYLETLHAPTLLPGNNEMDTFFTSLGTIVEADFQKKMGNCASFVGEMSESRGILEGSASFRSNPKGEQEMWFDGYVVKMSYSAPKHDRPILIEGLLKNTFSTVSSVPGKTLLQDLTIASNWDTKEHIFTKFIFSPESKIMATLHGPEWGGDPCEAYKGLVHRDGHTCCSHKCDNYCGAYDCDRGRGGPAACCAGEINKKQKICSPLQKAPCVIPESKAPGHGIEYILIDPQGNRREDRKGKLHGIGIRPVEIKLHREHEPFEGGVWTLQVVFMDHQKSLAVYEKKFAVLDAKPHEGNELLDLAQAFQTDEICMEDKNSPTDIMCDILKPCSKANWSSYFVQPARFVNKNLFAAS